MASIKVKFRPSAVADHEGSIYYQIIHRREVRRLSSAYRIYPSEWDHRRGMIRCVDSQRLQALRERVKGDLCRFRAVISRLERERPDFTSDDVVWEIRRYIREYSLSGFMNRIISAMKGAGRIRTAETYAATLSNFRKYRGGEDIMLDSFTPEVMEGYQAWQKMRGITPNTISFYMRILRAVYHRAVEGGVIENKHPFRRVYTGVDKTRKRALPLSSIRRLKNLKLLGCSSLDYARDMFLLSFYLRGMSFVDMAFLKKTDLQFGRVTYKRRKTGRPLIIAWTSEMQAILDKYPENESDYLLPIITGRVLNPRSAYRTQGCKINRNLKKLAAMIDVTIPLTLYVARHSWASAAKYKGVPLSVISEGMGHDSESTTQIYLASLDTAVIDRANALILQSLS
ncbi:MAG: site-specific integrase [Bacteroidales bacterium]|nr:site-specific integrase [Bacteroidales bacterium]